MRLSTAARGTQLFADPRFSNFTIVFAPYCDGGSWTGDAAPVATAPDSSGQGKPIFYRGRRLLRGLLQSVMAAGLRDATGPGPENQQHLHGGREWGV